MKAAMRAANPTKGRSKGSKGSSDNLDRMGNGGKPVVSRTQSLILEEEAMERIDQLWQSVDDCLAPLRLQRELLQRASGCVDDDLRHSVRSRVAA